MGIKPAKTLLLLFTAFLAFTVLSPRAEAGIVRLKTGKILTGVNIQEDDASVSMSIGQGKATIKIPRSRVDWVIRGDKEQIIKKAKAGSAFLGGVAALKSVDFQKAIPLLEKAMALEPGSAEIKADLAYAYARSGSADKAVFLYQEALETDPSNRSLRLNLASAYVGAGQFKKAAQILHKMLRDFPLERALYERLSLVFHRAGLYTLSVNYAKKAASFTAS